MAHLAQRSLALVVVLVACANDLRDDAEDDTAASTSPPTGDSTSSTDATTTDAPPASDSTSSEGSSSDETTSAVVDDSGDTSTGDIDDTGPWPSVDCVEGNDLIWVFDRDPDDAGRPRLQRFDPVAVELSPGPALECLAAYTFAGGASIAVDRAGTAYLSGATADTIIVLPVTDDDPCAAMTTIPWAEPLGLPRFTFRSEDLFDPGRERMFVFVTNVGIGAYGEIFHQAADTPFALYGATSVDATRLAGTGDGQLFGTGYDHTLHAVLPDHASELPILGAPDVYDRPIAVYDGGAYVFGEVADDEQEGMNAAGVRRFALDGSETYELVVLFADLPPLDLLDVTASTCAPTPFG